MPKISEKIYNALQTTLRSGFRFADINFNNINYKNISTDCFGNEIIKNLNKCNI